MPYYWRAEFTAQSRLVSALMSLYAQLEQLPPSHRPEITPFAVFMAFSVEAYLTSIGFRVVPFWEMIERVPWREKVEILHSVAGKESKWGQEPLQFLLELFRLRDRLAHGKPEQVSSAPFASENEVRAAVANPHLKDEPEWYDRLDRAWAMSAKDRFLRAMTYLGQLHGYHESDHLLRSSTSIEYRDV